jgi:heat shock protein HtpX
MKKRLHYEEIRSNKRKSVLLILIFVVLIGALGAAFGVYAGTMEGGIFLALFASTIYATFAYFAGGSTILTLSGAKPVKKKDFPHLFHTVEGLALAAGIPTPKCYVINDTALNAFATGRDPKNAAITVTTGLLKVLNRQELEGVIAHEMSHIKNYDIRFMMLTAVLVGIVTLLSDFLLRTFLWGGHGGRSNNDKNGQMQIVFIVVGLLLAILTPIIGQMVKLAISRKREYLADANGALLTRYPQGLADALKKISNDPDPLVDKANKATAHLFISTPFRKKKSFMTGLFATHPPIGDRIKRLESM